MRATAMRFEPVPYAAWRREILASPEPAWLLPNFLPANALTIIAGRPKYGRKSWISYMMAWSVASGRPIGPFIPGAPVPVLYVDLEGNAREAAKRPDLLRAGGMPVPDMDNLPMWQAHGELFLLTDSQHVQVLCDFITKHGIKAVFIDTYAKAATGVDENKAKDVGLTLLQLDVIKRLGCAVVLVHHLRKGYKHPPGEQLDATAALRGSGALEGGFDHIISATKANVDGEHNEYWLVGGKFMPFKAFTVGWTFVHDEMARLSYDGPHSVPVAEREERGAFGGKF